MDDCEICQASGTSSVTGKTQTVKEKGYYSLIEDCVRLGKWELKERLENRWSNNCVIKVHKECRCRLLKSKLPSSSDDMSPSRPKRVCKNETAQVPRFKYKDRCVICEEEIEVDRKHPDRKDPVHHASTFVIKQSLMKIAEARNDCFGEEVMGRLEGMSDLVSEEAVYHNRCYTSLYNVRPAEKPGRPVNISKETSFSQLCGWIDNEMESGTYTVTQLLEQMQEIVGEGCPIYGEKHLKEKLEGHYGNDIFITNQKRRKNLVCFKDCTADIIRKHHKEMEKNKDNEKEAIIKTAATLIRNDVKCMNFKEKEFPSLQEMTTEYELTDSLSLLLTCLVPSSVRRNVIGQNIISSLRPRSSKMPFQLGMSLFLDYKFGSDQLIDIMHRLGVCESAKETTDYKYTYINATNGRPSAASMEILDQQICQFVGDNIDHDLITLDGKSGFHGMGIIRITTPENLNVIKLDQSKKLERIKLDKGEILSNMEGLESYKPKKSNVLEDTSLIKYDDLIHRAPAKAIPTEEAQIDWYNGWIEGKSVHPNFMGYMHQRFTGAVLRSSIEFQRIINANPNDLQTVYTTLIRAIRSTPPESTTIVTFDLPLAIKAFRIVEEQDLKVVVRLGGFHFLKSYLGCIGYIMEGSGLEDAMGQIYGPNTVKYIMKGAAYTKALRGHFLVSAGLFKYMAGEPIKVDDFEQKKADLARISRTAKLWLLYHKLVGYAQEFLMAERLHDWNGHLNAVSKMLCIFAAAGHGQYGKMGRLYLQRMLQLPEQYPKVHKAFLEGNHTTRYSEEMFSGQFTDQTIEETLMRKAKSAGGLTRGRMRNESSIQVWAGTFSHLKLLGDQMEEMVCGGHRKRAHKDLGQTRMKNDNECVTTVTEWFANHHPFKEVDDPNTIASIASGLTTTDLKAVNCDDAEQIGTEIQKELDGESPLVVMKTSKKCKPLSTLQKKVKVGQIKTYIDKTQLFNRLIIMAERDMGIDDIFRYELTPVPTALFKMDHMMRKPPKHEFGRELKSTAKIPSCELTSKVHVIDGGWLLHQVRWTTQSINSIIQAYIGFVKSRYSSPTVVFDGYGNSPSTKDHEHIRRMGGKKVSPDYNVTLDAKVTCDREVFLANESNKKKFIQLLAQEMRKNYINTDNANDDADTLIVKTAIQRASNQASPVVVVAQDTDVLVLLCFHRPPNTTNLYLLAGNEGPYDISSISICEKGEFIFKYGWSGCDTVSYIHTHTKKAVYKMEFPEDVMKPFLDAGSSPESIKQAGIDAMKITYGIGSNESLAGERHIRFLKQANRGKIDPDRLPPTEDASTQHALRVQHQLASWTHMDTAVLSAVGRGWELNITGNLQPKMLSGMIAPIELLKGVCCKCKEGPYQCQTMRCSCRKDGMACIAACGVCCGHCSNGEAMMIDEDELNSDDDI